MDILTIILIVAASVFLVLVLGRIGYTSSIKREKKHQDSIDRFIGGG